MISTVNQKGIFGFALFYRVSGRLLLGFLLDRFEKFVKLFLLFLQVGNGDLGPADRTHVLFLHPRCYAILMEVVCLAGENDHLDI